jgi:hypothetical protein
MAVHGVGRDEERSATSRLVRPFGDEARDGELGRRQRRPTVRFGFGGDDARRDAELARRLRTRRASQVAPSSV